jgi:hypothetical protein
MTNNVVPFENEDEKVVYIKGPEKCCNVCTFFDKQKITRKVHAPNPINRMAVKEEKVGDGVCMRFPMWQVHQAGDFCYEFKS